MLLLLFFSCVLFELLPTLLCLLSFVSFSIFLTRVPFYYYVSHILHSHTSLSQLILYVNRQFSCSKNRFLVQPVAANLCVVYERGRFKLSSNSVTVTRHSLLILSYHDFVLQLQLNSYATTASLSVHMIMGNLGTHNRHTLSMIGSLI